MGGFEGRNVQGDPIMVQVNLSANALVARADFGWRVQASLPAGDKSALQQAQDFEDAWSMPPPCISKAFAATSCCATAPAPCIAT